MNSIKLLFSTVRPCRPSLRQTFDAKVAFLTLLLASAVVSGADSQSANAQSRPNILVIIADDLGYGDVGIHGARDLQTPHIDSIAREGVRLSCGYVSGPYCSPTRAGLMTGRYQQRFGHEFNPPGPNATNQIGLGLPLTEVTIANRLQAAGYVTGLIGKWHLGSGKPFHPLHRGFSEFYGFLGAQHSYTNLATTSQNPIYRNETPVEEPAYLTDAFTREALDFLNRHKESPFYLQLAYNAVHSPLDSSTRHLAAVENIPDPKRRAYASLYAAFDEGIGKVLARLRELGLDSNTLVVFFSDNGGPTNDNTSRNGPFRGFKAQTWEGGIHVPFFVRWPGRIKPGTTFDKPAIQLDVSATVLAAAGIQIQPEWNLDGVDLLPYLSGRKRGSPHEALYWRFGDQWAVRQGDWKLVKAVDGESNMRAIRPGPATVGGAKLFRLSKDPAESRDLVEKHPRKRRELEQLWQRWNAALPEPAWKPGTPQRSPQAATNNPTASVNPKPMDITRR